MQSIKQRRPRSYCGVFKLYSDSGGNLNKCNNFQTIEVLAEMLLLFPPIVTNISVKNFRVHFMGFLCLQEDLPTPRSLILTICTVSDH